MRTRIAAVLAVASIPLLASLMLGPSADASNLRKGRPGFTDLNNHYLPPPPHRGCIGGLRSPRPLLVAAAPKTPQRLLVVEL